MSSTFALSSWNARTWPTGRAPTRCAARVESNGPTRRGVVGLGEQERARAHGYEPGCAKAAQWSGRDRLVQRGCCGDDGQGVGGQGCHPGDGEGSPALIADLDPGGPKHIGEDECHDNADRAPRAVASFAGDTGGRRWTRGCSARARGPRAQGPRWRLSQISAAVVDPPPPSRVPPASDVAGVTKPTTTSAASLADCAGRRSERHGSAAAAPCSRR
jgi:hypothetical protein